MARSFRLNLTAGELRALVEMVLLERGRMFVLADISPDHKEAYEQAAAELYKLVDRLANVLNKGLEREAKTAIQVAEKVAANEH